MTVVHDMLWRIPDETVYMFRVFRNTEGAQMQQLNSMYKSKTGHPEIFMWQLRFLYALQRVLLLQVRSLHY
jgi:hypothetical protein